MVTAIKNTDQTDQTAPTTDDKRKALETLVKAFERAAKVYGNESDLLHKLVYSVDQSTRVNAINRIHATGDSVTGEACTHTVRLGGYEYTLTKETGKPDTTIVTGPVARYDRNGVKYQRDAKYAPTKNVQPSYADAISSTGAAIGRMLLGIANDANAIAPAQEDTAQAVKTPRKSKSATSDQMETMLAALLAMQAEIKDLKSAK